MRLTLVGLLVAVLAACTSSVGGSGPASWRDLDLVVPGGWMVLDERPDLLLLANEDLRDIGGDGALPLTTARDDNDTVAVQFTTDDTRPDAWRALIADEGGTLELDTRIEVGGLPATALTFRWTTNGVDTRERVVLVPSRQLIILQQPVPVQGQTTAPEVFDRHLAEFDELLASITFGAPQP